ncbi:sensor histidine kinase [Massilia cavernae]|uniref:histidine kinase n=1 Tax=Massilia cavernae TaxID=2320864 RepID=A0A418XT82_9BURK|nr:HAMP domain-containing sensor histidine kinase [Massilia cavernae]RJG15864.1 sensor histidine kinase [Massilia cavernae]
MSGARHGLRRRIVFAFAAFALLASLCFSAFSLVFVYVVEDSFFDNMLRQEAAHQQQAWDARGEPATPLRGFVSVHRGPATFPFDLARQFPASPGHSEFFGDQGRHYHVVRAGSAPFYLVAEVSGELVVRPRLPFIAGVLGTLAAALLAVTTAFGFWLARSATAPLDRLARLVSAAEPGLLPRGFAAGFPDNEIGAVATRLEQALDRIADFIEREQRFTQDASHELRTPVAVIDGAARLLAAQPMAPKAAAQVQRIAAAAAGMAQTVDTLLALAREELDQAAAEPVALLPLVEEIVVRHAHLLEGKAVEVQVEGGGTAAWHCHRAALEILLSNLVSNAFGHTSSGMIRIGADDGALVVADSGPGISPWLQERLYQPGAKGEASCGLGLGLSIAHRLAARAGFELSIGSEPGAGTRAVLRLAQFERFHSPSAA